MVKRVVVAGGRNYDNYEEAKRFIDLCIRDIRKQYTLIFVSGGAKGADALGERYASENGFSIERYPAEWSKYGKGAGPKRNKKMAEISDFVICFWNGESRGTRSMIDFAQKNGKQVKVKIYEE